MNTQVILRRKQSRAEMAHRQCCGSAEVDASCRATVKADAH